MSDADQLRLRAAALALDNGAVRDKPDSKVNIFADLGSLVSPLRARARASVMTSSSSSSGLAKSLAQSNAGAAGVEGGRSHSGELAVESNPSRHRRCGSAPLIFSDDSSSGGRGDGGDRGSTASSPMTNALPAGNICLSGCMLGAGHHRRKRKWGIAIQARSSLVRGLNPQGEEVVDEDFGDGNEPISEFANVSIADGEGSS